MVIVISVVVQGLSPVVPVEQRSAVPLSDLEAKPVASSACQGNCPNHVDLAAHDWDHVHAHAGVSQLQFRGSQPCGWNLDHSAVRPIASISCISPVATVTGTARATVSIIPAEI